MRDADKSKKKIRMEREACKFFHCSAHDSIASLSESPKYRAPRQMNVRKFFLSVSILRITTLTRLMMRKFRFVQIRVKWSRPGHVFMTRSCRTFNPKFRNENCSFRLQIYNRLGGQNTIVTVHVEDKLLSLPRYCPKTAKRSFIKMRSKANP